MADTADNWQQSVTWDREIDQTTKRLHDDLVTHNTADLKSSIANISADNMGYVDGNFKALYESSLNVRIMQDDSIGASDKQVLVSLIEGKETVNHLPGDENKYPTLTDAHSQDIANVRDLITDSARLSFLSLEAAGARGEAAVASGAKFEHLISGDSGKYAAEEQMANLAYKVANRTIGEIIRGYSDNQILAMQDFTKDEPQGGIFGRLLKGDSVSAENKDLIRQRTKAAGINL